MFIKLKKIFLSVFIFFCLSIFFGGQSKNKKINKLENKEEKKFNKRLIDENFFVFDSDNLKNVKQHMYGYSISKEGILMDNYYKQIGNMKFLIHRVHSL